MQLDHVFMHPVTYLAPACVVLALEAGTSVLNNGSLPPVKEEGEEDW
jgi:hypothetical protein